MAPLVASVGVVFVQVVEALAASPWIAAASQAASAAPVECVQVARLIGSSELDP